METQDILPNGASGDNQLLAAGLQGYLKKPEWSQLHLPGSGSWISHMNVMHLILHWTV